MSVHHAHPQRCNIFQIENIMEISRQQYFTVAHHSALCLRERVHVSTQYLNRRVPIPFRLLTIRQSVSNEYIFLFPDSHSFTSFLLSPTHPVNNAPNGFLAPNVIWAYICFTCDIIEPMRYRTRTYTHNGSLSVAEIRNHFCDKRKWKIGTLIKRRNENVLRRKVMKWKKEEKSDGK